MNKRKGISLIVLVITILVMIILAGVVVVSLQKNNPIEKAKEATFKQSLAQIGEELEMFCVNEKAQNSEFNKESLHASKNNLAFNTKKESSGKNIYDIIPSLKDSKYKNQVEVIQGNLFYRTPDKKEIPWLRELGIHYTGIVTGTVIIEGDTLVGVSPDYVNTGTLVIPNTVKKINEGAFAGCKDLYEVILPEGITEIPLNCFRNCTNLVKVVLPKTVTRIASYAFYECNNLENLEMPDGLTEIGDNSFWNCGQLTEINFKNIVRIGESTFRWCNRLAKVNFGNKLQEIGFISFGNTALVDVTLPDTIKLIGGSAFYDTDTLKTVKIGTNNIPRIILGDSIIRNCDGITSITIAENPSYKYVDNVRYNKAGTELQEVPANKSSITIESTVKRLNNGAFLNNSKITEIIVPEGVTYIGANAFNTCKVLNTVSLPSTVEEIGLSIVGSSMQLTNFTIHPQNKHFYMDKGSIVHKYLNSNGVEEREIIGTICSTSGVYKVSEGITILGEFAFSDCTKITELQIASTVKQMKKHSVYMATGINKLTIPGNVKIIENYALYYATGITDLVIEEGVKEIGQEAFAACLSLKNLSLPSTLEKIGYGILSRTNSLTNITVADSPSSKFTAKNNMIFTKDLTELVATSCYEKNTVIDVPNYVRVIRPYAMAGNNFVKEIRIKPGVTSIKDTVFIDCKSLTRLVIPSTVTTISSKALDRTLSLSEIVIDAPQNSIPGAPWGATQGMKAVIWQ